MPDYAVKIPFKGEDNVSSAINKARSSMKRFGDDSKSIFKRMSKNALSVKKVIGGILGARVITAGVGLVRDQVTGLTEEIIKLDSESVAAASKFGFDKQAEGFKKITDEARAVGAATKFTAGEAAEAIHFFAKAGYDLNNSLTLVAPTARLAMAAGLDLATTADIASDSLGAFGLNVDQYQKASDILAFTANSTNTTLEEMFETIKLGAPIVKLAGGDLSVFSALIRPMASAGIKGTLAATALKNAMLNMTAGTGSAKAEMDRLKISVKDSSGNLLDIVDILGQLETKFDTMGSAERVKSMSDIFGKRAVAGMSAVFDQGVKQAKDANKATISELRDQARKADGYVEKQAAKMSQSYENKILSIKSAIVEVGFTALEAFGKDIPKYLDIVVKKIRSIDPKEIKTGIQNFIKLTKTVISTVKSLIPIIKTVVAAWVSYKTVMGAIIAIHTVRHISNVANSLLGASRNANALTGNLRNASTATGTLNKGLQTSIGRSEALAGSIAAVVLSLKAGYEFGQWISEKFLQPHSQKQAEKFSKAEQASGDITFRKIVESKDMDETNRQITEINKALISEHGTGFSAENIAGNIASVFTGEESPMEKHTKVRADLLAKRSLLSDMWNKQAEQAPIMIEKLKQSIKNTQDMYELAAGIGGTSDPRSTDPSVEPTAGKINLTNKVKVDSTVSFKNEPKGTEVSTTISAPKINRAELGVN